jgi:DNA-directed RNA polymerase subunit beta'
MHKGKKGEGMTFANTDEAELAYDQGVTDLQAIVNVRITDADGNREIIETSVGRVILNSILPEELPFVNQTMRKKDMSNLMAEALRLAGPEKTVYLADQLKDMGFKFATMSGVSIAASDMIVPKEREILLEAANEKVRLINNNYWKGLVTAEERYQHAIRVWASTKNEISKVMVECFMKDDENDISYVIDSGARGNWGQVTQLSGMKGLVASPSGRTIELPIQSNLKQGFSVLEYFIATHGGRKGKSDTALKTAEAGYLTRRLVDAVQDILIREHDCGSETDHMITRKDSERIGEKF